MENIIKKQFKQPGYSSMKYIILAAVSVIEAVVALSYQNNISAGSELSACQVISEYSQFFNTMVVMYIGIVTGDICAGDFSDKTYYNELMSGRTRLQSFVSRSAMAGIVSFAGSYVIMLVPVITSIALYGWGTLFSPDVWIIRMAAMAAPLIRLICIFIFLSYVIKNSMIMAAAGVFGFSWVNMAAGVFDISGHPELTAVSSIASLSAFRSWNTLGINYTVNYVFEEHLTSGKITSVIIFSLLFSAVYLITAYCFFKKDDLN